MSVWDGWLPPSCKTCACMRLPLTGLSSSQGKVMIFSSQWVLVTLDSPRVIWDHATYSEANAISLRNATLLAQELLTESTNGTDNEDLVDRFVGRSPVFSRMGPKIASTGFRKRYRSCLSLFSGYAAIHERDVDALAIAIRVILRNQRRTASCS